jgi:hypothetical protein
MPSPSGVYLPDGDSGWQHPGIALYASAATHTQHRSLFAYMYTG